MPKLRFFVILIQSIVLSIFLNVPLTYAWEFNLSGSLMWTYEMYSQQGSKGFFGPYDVDASAPPGTNSAANLNLWNGINRAFNVQMASGSDVSISYLQGDFWPGVKINKALDIKGRFRAGGHGGYYYGGNDYQYRTWNNPGTLNEMGLSWPLLWGTAQIPWGTVAYGKRPMPFGTGLQYDGISNITSESLFLKTFYGPLSVGIGFYPYRQAPDNSFYDSWSSGGPSNIININSTSHHNQYYNLGDKSGNRRQDLYGNLIYSSGNLELGAYAAYFSYHIGPESVLQRESYNTVYLPRTSNVTNGTVYTKYNNGRFFLNAEAAWLYDTTKFDVSHFPTYVEQWRYMVELGAMSGPTKLSFLFGYSPGLDRRNGAYIGKQPAGFLREPQLNRELAGITLWKQYAYLMPYVYGAGLAGTRFEGFNSNEWYDERANQGLNQEGTMLDALVLASRLDYAVASNLNIFGSFFYAERTSRSYPWGFVSPQYSSDSYAPYVFYTGNVMFHFDANPTSPSIPDTSLGYEIDLGLSWKLLENWTVDLIASRWQPGRWFSYACVDKSTNWRTPTSANNYGTNPGRNIDPIIGLRVDLTSSF